MEEKIDKTISQLETELKRLQEQGETVEGKSIKDYIKANLNNPALQPAHKTTEEMKKEFELRKMQYEDAQNPKNPLSITLMCKCLITLKKIKNVLQAYREDINSINSQE